MPYYRHRLVSQVRCRWLGLLALVMQIANSSSNSLLKVMTTYICCLILCAQPAPRSCLHLGASVRGRLTSSSHAHAILKSQGAVDGISLLTVTPSSWMQGAPFHSKKCPCFPACNTAVTDRCLSSSAGLQNCPTFTLGCLGPATPHLGCGPNSWGRSSWLISVLCCTKCTVCTELCWEGGLNRGSERMRQWGTGWGHSSEELSLELSLWALQGWAVCSAQCWALGAFVELSGTSLWKREALKCTLGLIAPDVPVPGGDTACSDGGLAFTWELTLFPGSCFVLKNESCFFSQDERRWREWFFVLESNILQSVHSQVIFQLWQPRGWVIRVRAEIKWEKISNWRAFLFPSELPLRRQMWFCLAFSF